jgi:hypothetical protein
MTKEERKEDAKKVKAGCVVVERKSVSVTIEMEFGPFVRFICLPGELERSGRPDHDAKERKGGPEPHAANHRR